MERRRAVAIAAASAATTVGAVAAIAVNFGLLGFGQPASTAGKLEAGRVAQVIEPAGPPPASGVAPNVIVRYEDIYVPAPAPAPVAPAPTGVGTPQAVVDDPAPSAGVEDPVVGGTDDGYDDGYGYDDDDDDDHEDDDHEDDDHEDDDHEDDDD